MSIDQKQLSKALNEIGIRILEGESLQGSALFSEEDCKLLYSLGFSLYHGGDFFQSITVFKKLVQCYPLDKTHWSALAAALQMNGEFEKALTSWSMSALLDDSDPTPHFHAGECLLSMKQPSQAIVAFQCARKRISNDSKLREKIDSYLSIWEDSDG